MIRKIRSAIISIRRPLWIRQQFADRPSLFDSKGKSDIPADDFIDDDEVSQISALDGDFDAFPIDNANSVDPIAHTSWQG
jgi:hypothetical protein